VAWPRCLRRKNVQISVSAWYHKDMNSSAGFLD
jgi:hypothetical protein